MSSETHEKALRAAEQILESGNYQATKEAMRGLSDNIILLEQRGLDKLNQKLVSGIRNIWDIFSELNFAIALISQHGPKIPISYEPDETSIDFRVEIGTVTHWIQVKRSPCLERQSRRDRIMKQIEREIHIGKFFTCKLSEDFEETDVADLIEFIAKAVSDSKDGEEYLFPGVAQPKASVEFRWPKRKKLSHLTLERSGDLDWVEITGLAKKQIRGSLDNAAKAFR